MKLNTYKALRLLAKAQFRTLTPAENLQYPGAGSNVMITNVLDDGVNYTILVDGDEIQISDQEHNVWTLFLEMK